MKHLIGLMLALVMLTGCAAGAAPAETTLLTTAPVTTAIPEGTEPSAALESTYVSDSAMERQTDGAVRMYCPDIGEYTELVVWGDNLLVLSGEEQTTLTLLECDTLAIGARIKLDCRIYAANGGVQVGKDGITYFCDAQDRIIFTDRYLNETRYMELPAGMTGGGVVSPDGSTVYYCTEAGVHAIDLRTGITRLLKEQTAAEQMVTGIYFDGNVLGCSVRQENGTEKNVYISAQTGETVHDNRALDQLCTYGDRYFSRMEDGSMDLCLTGKGNRDLQQVDVPLDAELIPVLACGGVVLQAQDTLSFVDLTRAGGAAKISTAGLMDIQVLGAGEDCVWFAAWVEKQKAQCLFRWDPSQTKTENDRTYLEPYYTADNPNLDGLQACKELARTLGDRYGVNILIWNDTDAYHPWDYTFIPEHRPEIYRRDLQALEEALQKFPEGFLNEAASGSDNGRLTICLVRGLKREEQTNAPENAYGAQYWMEDSPYIALAVGESLEQTFYHQISHLIDSCVISTSKAYDDWEYLNPWEFNYDYDYEENKNREDEGYLDDENRLFIDTYSMSYPREDRARILEYAMMPGNESYFASEQMQEKLSVICNALREVFDLDPDQQYAWEQYLKDSE